MSAPAIVGRALAKRYAEHTAVDGVDLTVDRGTCLGLLGPNGAGKTTTVEMLEGLCKPDSGSVELFGIPWGQGRDQEMRERFGAQLQETQLADKLTVFEVFTLFRSFYKRGRHPEELLEMLDLKEERGQQFATLSGGQKQRVALGCALAGNPDLLFLDEPTTGLDPRARQSLWHVVEHFRAAGGTVLITTHYMEEAAFLCDRIAIMDRGKIITEGTPLALVDSLGLVQFVEFQLPQSPDQAALRALQCVETLEQRGERYRLRIERSLASLVAVLAELERQQLIPIGLTTHQATLDDVFLELTGRQLRAKDNDELSSAGGDA
jgi:ABC-2 type transport system ATP-binding protein